MRLTFVRLAAVVSFGLLAPAAANANEVNVYSLRQPGLLQPILDAFTKETGIKTNVVFADKGLIERMAQEGSASPADLLVAADIGLLASAVEQGVTQPLASDVIAANIPAQFIGPDNQWVALTGRARVFYASKARVTDTALTYADLADPKWKGKICVRSGAHPYNVALIADMIARIGEPATKAWLAGFRANLVRKPAGGDRDQAKAVFSGECDIAVGNTYYVGLMATNQKEPEQQEWAKAIRVVFPDQGKGGTHMNVSGVTLGKYAPNKANAIKLVEYMTKDEAQRLYASGNSEFPLKPGVARSEVVASWGDFETAKTPLGDIAKNRKRASELVDEVGFDQGPSS